MVSIPGPSHDIGSIWERVTVGFRGIFRRRKRPGTALVPFTPSREATELRIRAALDERSRIATGFVERARLGYRRLKPAPRIATVTDGIGDTNLVDDPKPETQALLQELGEQSKHYFDYKVELFKFHRRFDRGVWSLFKRPQTYADVEEENIEEKFPGDIRSRALMCGLNMVIKYNQWKHIAKKRLLQVGFTMPVALLYVWWTSVISYVAGHLPAGEAGVVYWWADKVDPATAIVLALGGGYIFGATLLMRYFLSHMMHMFEEVNANSCQVLSNHMNKVSAKIKGIYIKLLITDITLSQNTLESIKSEDWPWKVERVFRLALWVAKRVEYLEQFWQLQLERLRLFETVSDFIGNFVSWFLTFLLIGGAIGASYLLYGSSDLAHSGILLLVVAAWYFGRVTRKPEYSFGMDDIVRQGFEGDWSPFSTVKFYDNIAQQFRSSKGDIRINKLRDVLFTQSSPANPPKRG
ncbi:MAG: hypothetical protein AB7O44_19950 [Hyphomicrobiaceae bacterium]